jgi:hypothetical protein
MENINRPATHYSAYKQTDPGSLSDYRTISVLPALSEAMKIIMKNVK